MNPVKKSRINISKIDLFDPPSELIHLSQQSSDSSSFSSTDSESEEEVSKKVIILPKYKEVKSTQVMTSSFNSEYMAGYLGYYSLYCFIVFYIDKSTWKKEKQ